MASNGLDVFDNTTFGSDRHVARLALGVVLRPLRDVRPLGLAVHLGAELPLLVRGLYYDQGHQHRARWSRRPPPLAGRESRGSARDCASEPLLLRKSLVPGATPP